MPHLFEFMDLDWLPSSLRGTLREILLCACNKPFRPYYAWVADRLLDAAKAGGYTTLVELGAGPAPITSLLAKDPRSDGLRLVPCDLNPDGPAYDALAKRYPGKVVPRYDPVDFSRPREWGPHTLLYLSGAFHHIPPEHRAAMLSALTDSAECVQVFEPLRKTVWSMLFVLASIIPALLIPIWLIGRPGRLRRLFWCWLFPVAPLMFWWEGMISCLRMWSDGQWRQALAALPGPVRHVSVASTLFCQAVSWQGSPRAELALSPSESRS
jgi:hypothetical protein